MSIIKLTDPRYCSPLDSPNTHLSSSKGRVFVVPLLSGELSMANLSQKRERRREGGRERERAYNTKRIETGTHRWSPGGFPWFSTGTRAQSLHHRAYELRNYCRISETVPQECRVKLFASPFPHLAYTWILQTDLHTLITVRSASIEACHHSLTSSGMAPRLFQTILTISRANFQDSRKQASGLRNSWCLTIGNIIDDRVWDRDRKNSRMDILRNHTYDLFVRHDAGDCYDFIDNFRT